VCYWKEDKIKYLNNLNTLNVKNADTIGRQIKEKKGTDNRWEEKSIESGNENETTKKDKERKNRGNKI